MKKAFYIFSFNNNNEIYFDWFVGQDFDDYNDQTKEVLSYMVSNDYAENKSEASEMLENIYKQDTDVLVKQLTSK